MELGGLWMPVAPKGEHRVKHSTKYNDADDYTDGQTDVVKVLDAAAKVGNACAQINIRSKYSGRTNTQKTAYQASS
jgi:hypothetical protein